MDSAADLKLPEAQSEGYYFFLVLLFFFLGILPYIIFTEDSIIDVFPKIVYPDARRRLRPDPLDGRPDRQRELQLGRIRSRSGLTQAIWADCLRPSTRC